MSCPGVIVREFEVPARPRLVKVRIGTMGEKVSIIIPVYNARNTIARCIDSLLRNCVSNIEIIAINDGSLDGSLEVLQRYEAMYPETMRIYNQDNEGVARTRNSGIKYATGEYVMFVDNDDYVDLNYIARFVAEIENTKADIVMGGYRRTDGNQTLWEVRLASTEWAKYMVMAPWAKIYRRSFLVSNELAFLVNNIGEDVYFNLLAINLTDKITTVRYCGYNWVYNTHSVSNTKQKSIKNELNVIRLLDSCYRRLNEFGVLEKKENEFWFIRYIIWYLLFTGRKSDPAQMVTEYRKVFSWLRERFPEFRRNRNISLRRPQGDTLRNRALVYLFMLLHRLGLIPLLFRFYCIGKT